MLNITKLYEAQNRHILESISVMNFALGFDKSVMNFKKSDLFSFLERVNICDFKIYDDVFYMIQSLVDAFKHVQVHLSSQLRRTHELMRVERTRELDSKSIEWISKRPGLNLRQKLGQGRVLGVKRFVFIDTPENRVLKIVLMRLLALLEARAEMIEEEGFLVLAKKISRFLKDELAEVNHKAQIIPNNILLHHKHYAKFYKVYKWLNALENMLGDFENFKNELSQTREALRRLIALAVLHKNSNAKILPSELRANQKHYQLSFDPGSLLNANIEDFLNEMEKLSEFKEKCEEDLEQKISNYNGKIKLRKSDRDFGEKLGEDENVFIDLFKAYPLCRIKKEVKKLPLLLRQKIRNKYINANDTKIINLNLTSSLNEIFLDEKLLHIFLNDLQNRLGNTKSFHYILPDFINVFDFANTHRSIRSYFSGASFIPKSFLYVAIKLFKNELKEGDTLVFIQQNNALDFFVTPILVRFSEKLMKAKTSGLWLEKHPCRKIESGNSNVENNDFKNLIKKFGKSGVRELKKEDIKFYKNGEIFELNTAEMKPRIWTNEEKIKELYKDSKMLFKGRVLIINESEDPSVENELLESYSTLISQKDAGFLLFKERLPRLDLEINTNIKTVNFALVSDESELDENGKIKIKAHFIIPKNQKYICNPLIFDGRKSKYFMLLQNHQMPFEKDVECSLELSFSYEAKNAYELTFIPLDSRLRAMSALWLDSLPSWMQEDLAQKVMDSYPPFPPVKSINELKNYPKKDGLGSTNLFEWVQDAISRVNHYLTIKHKTQATIYSIKQDFFFAYDDDEDQIFCHNSKFIDDIESIEINDYVYLDKIETDRGFQGLNISFWDTDALSQDDIDRATRNLFGTRFPMITIFNGHSLEDKDMPNAFKESIKDCINLMREIDDHDFRGELLYFCSLLHQDSPVLDLLSQNVDTIARGKYKTIEPRVLAYAIGNAKQEAQKKIFAFLLNGQMNSYTRLMLLSICLWRDENLVFSIDQVAANKIIDECIFKNFNTKALEILLALLRLRKNGLKILMPNQEKTQTLLQNLLRLSLQIIAGKRSIRSFLVLEINKPKEFEKMHDLIYALISLIKGENKQQIKIKINYDNEA